MNKEDIIIINWENDNNEKLEIKFDKKGIILINNDYLRCLVKNCKCPTESKKYGIHLYIPYDEVDGINYENVDRGNRKAFKRRDNK